MAKGEQMPFADETFDLVISYAGPAIIKGGAKSREENQNRIHKVFGEISRVLKTGGEARIAPPRLSFLADFDERVQPEDTAAVEDQSTQYLKDHGIEVELGHHRNQTMRYWVLHK